MSQNNVHMLRQLGQNANRFPFISYISGSTAPRKESYFHMIHNLFFPRYRLYSISSILLVTLIFMYLIALKGGINTQGTFLQVDQNQLIQYGALVPSEVKNYQYWQLVTSLFLSFDFLQLFFNCFWVLMLASNIEFANGAITVSAIFFGGGVIGNIFGTFMNCCTTDPFLETNTAIYALIGSIIGFFILNWEALQALSEFRCFALCILWMISMLLMLINFSKSEKLHDKYSTLGGFLAGLFICMAVATPMKHEVYESKVSIFGWTFVSILAGVSFVMILII